MNETHPSSEKDHQPVWYEIRVQGHLSDRWEAWFEGFNLCLDNNGQTLITGWIIDQAALHGLLRKVRDLGMTLISVNPHRAGPAAEQVAGCED